VREVGPGSRGTPLCGRGGVLPSGPSGQGRAAVWQLLICSSTHSTGNAIGLLVRA
jgi:hypothetical protein